MLTKTDLLNQNNIPNIRDVSLALYKDFSVDILLNRIFRYKFIDGSVIDLEFTEWGIYHILSIQHINGRISKDALFEEIDNGLSFDEFKNSNAIKRRFSNQKKRITTFACIYNILKNGMCFYLPTGKVQNTANVKLDYLVFTDIDGKGLNLGIRHTSDDKYVPISMLIAKTKNKELYIEGSERKMVESLTILEKPKVIEVINYNFNIIDKTP